MFKEVYDINETFTYQYGYPMPENNFAIAIKKIYQWRDK